ncbi:alpha/beta fold hydrolase [Flavobacterium silvaticum]|uniref:Alpha/beta hydrolase n=1 Tax=Flavobacterium silvaticum TaxID=1852020 RepID=A0A972FTS1_9FLAO|nr:alpha/beta hydrolase [Flavobacterium silvaticum]NMH29179.1 alpha/beta hydrolase [Flavobacterium silvaticum]
MSGKSGKSSGSLQIPKAIQHTATFLGAISPKLQTRFAARLFTSPIRHKRPSRELPMLGSSRRQILSVPSIGKEIVCYEYGLSLQKVLLVHGWSGRGTQLVKIADALIVSGYSIVSFDAPAHGNSKGSTTIMTEFIESILEIEKTYGPFEAAVGHSLGGMSLLNAVASGFKTKALVTIGSGNKISDILIDFVNRLGQKEDLVPRLRDHFEAKFLGKTMESYSAYIAAKEIEIPVLVIHDKKDMEVPVSSAEGITAHLQNATLMLTQDLGHRKILGNPDVIQTLVDFIKTKTQ